MEVSPTPQPEPPHMEQVATDIETAQTSRDLSMSSSTSSDKLSNPAPHHHPLVRSRTKVWIDLILVQLPKLTYVYRYSKLIDDLPLRPTIPQISPTFHPPLNQGPNPHHSEFAYLQPFILPLGLNHRSLATTLNPYPGDLYEDRILQPQHSPPKNRPLPIGRLARHRRRRTVIMLHLNHRLYLRRR
jgi:hypothetical protein